MNQMDEQTDVDIDSPERPDFIADFLRGLTRNQVVKVIARLCVFESDLRQAVIAVRHEALHDRWRADQAAVKVATWRHDAAMEAASQPKSTTAQQIERLKALDEMDRALDKERASWKRLQASYNTNRARCAPCEADWIAHHPAKTD